MLSRFRLEFFSRLEVGDKGEVDDQGVVGPEVPAHLADGFDEGERFDIAHGTPDFGDDEVVFSRFAEEVDVAFDFVGDVGDDLYGFAQEFPFSFAGDDIIIYASRGDVIGLGGSGIEESFVVAQVEVCFGPIVGDEALAVFVGVERSGVDVDIGVEFLDRDFKAAGLEEHAEGSGDDSFAQGGGYAAGDEDILSGGRHLGSKFRSQR